MGSKEELNETLLRKTLDYHNKKYYDEDAPEITDAEYDVLKNKYIELTGDEYEYVPGNANFNRYSHKHRILSLSKVNDKVALRKELERLAPGVIQPKYDGLTLVAENGTITTRGNGIEGEEVLNTARYIDNGKMISNLANHAHTADARGEAYIKKSVFEIINSRRETKGDKPFENARNAVAGMIRNNKIEKEWLEVIEFTAYDIPGWDVSEHMKLRQLEKYGYNIPDQMFFYDNDPVEIDAAMKWIENFEKVVRNNLDYEVDGLVVKANYSGSQANFGVTGHHPKNAVAYKFANQGLFTAVLGVTWQTGRTGKITPVAELEPVKILGSTISRATLNNMGYIKALGLTHLGQLVKVVKANDVIPCITEVNKIASRSIPNPDLIVEPDKCPACGGPVGKINDQLYCTNNSCNAKLANMIAHIAKKDALDIKGLSIETAQKMVDMDLVKETYQIFGLSIEQIQSLAGFAKKSATQLYKAIQGARNPEFKNFLYAAGVQGVGRSVCETLANEFEDFPSFFKDINKDNASRCRTLEGIGNIMASQMVASRMEWAKLFYYVVPKTPSYSTSDLKDMFAKSKSQTQLTFVITGTLGKDRRLVEADIKAKGHKVTSSVSSKTDYVIVGQNPGGTKYDKAEDLNIQMINEGQLYKILEK